MTGRWSLRPATSHDRSRSPRPSDCSSAAGLRVGDRRPSSRRSSYCTAEAAAIERAVITANGDSPRLQAKRARTIWAKECWAREFNLLSVPIPLPPIPLPIPGSSRHPGNDSGKVRSETSGHGNRAMFPSRFFSGTGTTRPIAHTACRANAPSDRDWAGGQDPAENCPHGGNGTGRPMIVPRPQRPWTNGSDQRVATRGLSTPTDFIASRLHRVVRCGRISVTCKHQHRNTVSPTRGRVAPTNHQGMPAHRPTTTPHADNAIIAIAW